jgi:hypothetical protein
MILRLFRNPAVTSTLEKIDQWQKAGTEFLMRFLEQSIKLNFWDSEIVSKAADDSEIVPKSGCDKYTGENRPMTESWNRISHAIFGTIYKISTVSDFKV